VVAHFPDLTPYTYFPAGTGPALNVGWLDPAAPFPTGDTSPEFCRKLGLLCQRPVQQTRGLHFCPYCPWTGWPDQSAGSAEIRVAGERAVYAAPTLVHHYVVAHGYKPPDEFVAAVLAWEPDAEPFAAPDPAT
jgi:hypothetical protein